LFFSIRFIVVVFGLFLLLAASSVRAGLSIRGTRVVFDEARGEANVRVAYTTGRSPILMQAWLDDDNLEIKPGEHDLPFVITPMISRMDPGDIQLLRILRTRDGLPQDRETLLYFNVLEIPPSAAEAMEAGRNYLQFSMQARLKFFYRPKGLSPEVTQAVNMVRFAWDERVDEDGRLNLRVENPTPYHIVLSALALHANDDDDAPALAIFDRRASFIPTIEPFADMRVPLNVAADGTNSTKLRQRLAQGAKSLTVRYTVINDHGGHNPKEQTLDHAP